MKNRLLAYRFADIGITMLRFPILIFIALLAWSINLTAADWPQWRGPGRNGISSETGLLRSWSEEGPELLWTTSVGVGASSMAVHDNYVYTMGNINDEDVVICLNRKTGDKVWSFSYACPFKSRRHEGGTSCTPTVDGNRVYTLSYEGDLYCLDATSGRAIWSKSLRKEFNGKPNKFGYAGSPLVVDDMVIVESGADEGSLLALNKKSGRFIWKSGDYNAGYSSPVAFQLNGKQVGLIFNGYGLVGHRLEDGKELWNFKWNTSYDINAATPIVSEKYIFISSGYGTGGAVLNVGRGKLTAVWKSEAFANQFSSSVLWKGHLYGFHGNVGKQDASLRCVEFATGNIIWEKRELGIGSVILVDKTLVILSEGGELVLAEASPSGYTELERLQVLGGRCWVTPAYADGLVYCRNNNGKMVCYNLGEKL